MPRELVADKAKRYLAEGRVTVLMVNDRRVVASVKGDGAMWRVAWHFGTWTCTCPNSTTCCHLRAVRLITAPDTGDNP